MAHSTREQEIVKRALAHGYLSGAALREALLLRSQLAQAGRPADLLAILRARYLRAEQRDTVDLDALCALLPETAAPDPVAG